MPENKTKVPTSGAAMYSVQKEHNAEETEISVEEQTPAKPDRRKIMLARKKQLLRRRRQVVPRSLR